jgi:5-methylcytosine-specific restriction enzyme A
MSGRREFHEVMLGLHQRTGRSTGYWPGRFLNAVRNHGGLAYAKRLLRPGLVSEGFEKLVAASRADLSVEYLALSDPFRHLFTKSELAEARSRLASLGPDAFPREAHTDFPEEVNSGLDTTFLEGAVRTVSVNRHERNPRARAACVRHHGARCRVCEVSLGERYGEIGEGFIHVHHLRPLSGPGAKKRVDPRKDLIPVCPNCHSMLHRTDPPMDPEDLKRRMESI